MEIMGEEYWSVVFRTGAKGQPGYYFVLDFQNLPHEAIEGVRASAEVLLREQGAHRSLVRNTARAIVHLCSRRLLHPAGAPETHYLVQAVWDPRESREVVDGDRARI
jgi:hypothetical protein